MKICKTCKKSKPLDMYYKHSRCKQGVRPECKVCWDLKTGAYYNLNKNDITKYKANWHSKNKNKPEKKEIKRKKEKEKWHNNPLFKLQKLIRYAVRRAFKNNAKTKRSTQLLGCTIEEAKAHIERQFQNGMTWENHGQWHIDHIKPLAVAKTSEEAEKLCHYTNLQPLWAIDNIKKGSKYESI